MVDGNKPLKENVDPCNVGRGESESRVAVPSFTILADLDGTVLPAPFGSPPVHPPVQDGPAFAPLVRLLEAGATIIGVTGSEISTHSLRFFSPLPLEARKSGKVLIAVNTGRKLFRGCAESGDPIEDRQYGAEIDTRVPLLDSATINTLVAIGRAGIRRFLIDLRNDPTLVAEGSPLFFMREKTSLADEGEEAIPVNPADGFCPRVEIRSNGAGVTFVGVPYALGARYFQVPAEMQQAVEGKPVGRICFDCLPRGISKGLVVEYLLKHQLIAAGRTVALGDRPAGNDEGLTLWHETGIPFISVAEHPDLVPSHLKSAHVTACSNEHASAAVLAALAARLEDSKQPSLRARDVEALVQRVNQGAASADKAAR